MKNGKKLGLTIFQVVLSIILIALVIFSVGVNYIFGSSTRSGKVFGKNVYIMMDDSMDSEGGIENGAAVIADSEEISVLSPGNVILFNEEAGIETIMRVIEVEHNTDSTVYRVAADKNPENILNVPKENVIAKCTVQSAKLGSVITFLKSMVGILAGMILPCLILLVMLMLKVFSVKRRQREEANIVYPETNGIGSGNSEVRNYGANPLFDPASAPKPGASFEMKKSSIAENFAMKPAAKKNMLNPNEKAMQRESAVERFKAAVDEKPPVPVSRKASLAPEMVTNDRDEKMAAIKAALHNNENAQAVQQNVNAEKTAAFNINDINSAAAKPQPQQSAPQTAYNPLISPQKQPQQPAMQQQVRPQSTPQPVPQPKPAAPKPATKHDNIKSIDDLIKALEQEKNKL